MASAQPSPTRTYDFSGGTNAVADQVDTELNTLFTVLQGGIGNVHIADDAAIAFSKLASSAWTTFTPTWAGGTPAIGNGTLSGAYVKIGRIVIATYNLLAGSTTTFGSGNYTLSLPLTASATPTTSTAIGVFNVENAGTQAYIANARIASTTTMSLVVIATDANTNLWSATHPFTFGDTDFVRGTIIYEAAA